jgi:hypothetical protein
MPLKSICSKKLGFIEQKCIFEHYREVRTRKNLLIDIIFGFEFFSDSLFRAAPYRLMVVLHKGALFHWLSKVILYKTRLADTNIIKTFSITIC